MGLAAARLQLGSANNMDSDMKSEQHATCRWGGISRHVLATGVMAIGVTSTALGASVIAY